MLKFLNKRALSTPNISTNIWLDRKTTAANKGFAKKRTEFYFPYDAKPKTASLIKKTNFVKHNDNFLELIREAENDNQDKISKLISSMTIETTKDFAGFESLTYKPTKKEFRPNLFFKISALTFVFWLFIGGTKTLFFDKNNLSNAGIIFIFLFLVFLVFGAIKQFFFDKSLNYKISIDKDQITIGNRTFKWEEIYDTAILTDPSGKKTEYLVIALNNLSTYEKYDLGNFISFYNGGFSVKLSQYIEYFKTAR